MKINAIIENKDGGTLVLDFPRSIYDVYEKLQSVGIRKSPHQIALCDEECDDVRVKLYSEDEVGKHLLLTLNEQNSLADANMLVFMVDNAKADFRSKLEQNLLHDQYSSMQEVTDDIKQMLYESGPVKAVFYCPLVGEVTDDEGFSSPVDGRFLKSYKMRTKIYQINSKRDVNRVKFEGLELLERYQGSSAVDPSIYDEVFSAEIDETDLEAIYQRFNTVGHPLHRGHSLSVSDVVVNDNGAFFCDSIGFQPIAFDESQTQKPDNLMRVVYVEPHKAPYIADVAHTLEAEQKAVGDGLIEPIDNYDGTCLVGNEESKLRGMDGNRRIGDGSSIMAGPFFVCGDSGESFRSLTDEEVTRYMARFAEPEDISPEEVEADMGFMIYPM